MRKIFLVLVIVMMTTALVFARGSSDTSAQTGGGAITVEIFDRGTDGGRSLAYNNAWTNWIKEKVKRDLNLDVTFVPVGRWSEETDLVNLFASGSAPDLCYTYNGGNVQNFRNQGGLLNLAPYIDQYLPDLKRLLGDDPAITGKPFIERQKDVRTGEIYSIQSARVALAQRNIWIRKDWLDALRLPMPTTIQQFYTTLTAFRTRANELPGNIGTRVVPLMTGDDVRWNLADFMNHYMQSQTDRERWVRDIYESNFFVPGYKEGVREMNKWYNEGLIYHDFPLMRNDEPGMVNMLKSGVVGAIAWNWDSVYRVDHNINNELARNVSGAEFVPVDLNLSNKAMMDKSGLYMFIPASSRNPTGALRYLNWLAIPENYRFLQVGTEGVNHVIENGVPRILAMTPNHPWFQNSAQNIDMTMPMNGVQMGSDALNSRVLALGYGDVPSSKIEQAYAISVKNARAPMIYIVTTTVTQYSQTLTDKRNALLIQAIAAPAAQFDSIYDNGYQDWLRSGAQEVYNERDRLYPR
ncbi:MAG: extracellular solute-binding protein [Treponema sp.]|nr:extracellular solute-binding protein [Treponema sp.]